MSDVRQWLGSLGLGQYADAFEENAIDAELLSDLTEERLERLGVAVMGHRIRLLRAIAARTTAETAPPPSGPVSASTRPVSTTEAERRQLTVMFCDLVGSVELGERMEVEEYRDLLGHVRTAVVGAVRRFGGFVARHQGDGLLAYFGYPQAHEDDAERAVRAALEVVHAVEALEHPSGVEPKVRIGIATGPVIAGDVLSTGTTERSELAALGPTPNLAARLQGEAEASAVLISDTTKQLVGSHFVFEQLPARTLKGMGTEVIPHRVLAALAGKSRFAARAGARLTPFVARDEELMHLQRRWSRAASGKGQVVLLLGEAGIGKSRLMEQLRARIGTGSHAFVSLQCSPYHGSSVLYPVVSGFERLVGLAAVEPGNRITRLREHLAELGDLPDESLGSLADCLSIPIDGLFPALEALDVPQRRERMLSAMVDYFKRRAALAPVLCIIEDVHWADPSTRELLGRLVDAVEHSRILMLVSTRPGFDAPWADSPQASVLTLSRLDRHESTVLARAVGASPPELPNAAVDSIVDRAAGNPLFIEELARSMALSGAETGYEGSPLVPETLQDSLMARLDALGGSKAVAQVAAVLGAEAPLRLLKRLWDGEPSALDRGLRELQTASILEQRGDDGEPVYRFRHALVREVAYASLLRSARRELHGALARILGSDSRRVEEELLAFHLERAGDEEHAAEAYYRAAVQATARSAFVEAVTHYGMAIELSERARESVPSRLALDAQIGLATACAGAYGQGATVTIPQYEKAREKLEHFPADPRWFAVQWGLFVGRWSRGEVDVAHAVAESMCERAQATEDEEGLCIARRSLAMVQNVRGEFELAESNGLAAVRSYDESLRGDSDRQYVVDIGAGALAHLGVSQCFLGLATRADASFRRALALAEELERPFSIAFVKWWWALSLLVSGELERALVLTQSMERGAQEHHVAQFTGTAPIMAGCSMVGLGDLEAGLRLIREGWSRLESFGLPFGPMAICFEARAHAGLGRIERARELLREGMDLSEQAKMAWWLAELHRVGGEVHRQCGSPSERTEECFLDAIEIARAQKARPLELAATVSLARHWGDAGRVEEARALLSTFYEGFVGDLATPMHEEARALLDELS